MADSKKKKSISSTIRDGGSKKPAGSPRKPKSGGRSPASTSRPSSKPSKMKPAVQKREMSSSISGGTQKPSPSMAQKSLSKEGMPASESTLAEQEARLASLRTHWERVVGLAGLAALADHLEDISSEVQGLDGMIGDLRARGYRFGQGWEAQSASLKSQWVGRHREAMQALDQERSTLQQVADEAGALVNRAARSAGLVDTAEDRISAMERRIREAENRVEGVFDKTQENIEALQHELAEAAFVMEMLETASFKLYPEEYGFAVAKAQWLAKGTDEIEGLLFLTSSRLLFEQREEVATKKFLFITTEKKLVQELLWQAPVGGTEVIEIQDEKAFMSRKEMLTLRLDGGDAPPEVTVCLKNKDNETWAAFIRRTKEGTLDAERYDVKQEPAPEGEGTEETAEAAPSTPLPTRCPTCSAPLPTIYKGMQQVTCDYCGMVIRLDQ